MENTPWSVEIRWQPNGVRISRYYRIKAERDGYKTYIENVSTPTPQEITDAMTEIDAMPTQVIHKYREDGTILVEGSRPL